VVRAYNDAVDDQRRRDLYRFAADAVGTRGDYSLQRARAELALAYVRERRGRPRLPEPERDAGPEEVADYVLLSLARRPRSRSPRRRWDDASHADMLALLERLIATGGGALFGELVEHSPEPVEYGGGDQEIVVRELLQGGAEPGLDFGAPGFDEGVPALGERGEDYAAVAIGARAFDEAGVGECVEHLGDAGWAEVGILGELGGG
jgi:hypothetical protein